MSSGNANQHARIGNLSELLGATDDPGGWWSLNWRERATVHVQQDKKHLRSTAVLKTLNLGGRSSVLLVQSVTVPAQGILPAAKLAQGATDLHAVRRRHRVA